MLWRLWVERVLFLSHLHWFILYSGFPGLCSPLNRLSYYVPRANVSIHTFIFSILTYSSDTNLEGLDN